MLKEQRFYVSSGKIARRSSSFQKDCVCTPVDFSSLRIRKEIESFVEELSAPVALTPQALTRTCSECGQEYVELYVHIGTFHRSQSMLLARSPTAYADPTVEGLAYAWCVAGYLSFAMRKIPDQCPRIQVTGTFHALQSTERLILS